MLQRAASVFFEQLYRAVNAQAIGPFFRGRLRNGSILDAGCGPGFLARELRLKEAILLDINPDHVRRCRASTPAGLAVQADIRSLPLAANSFDTVICSNVLHHTGLPGLTELVRVTRVKGRLLLAFLEESPFTRAWIGTMVTSGLFPPDMLRAQLIDLRWLDSLSVQVLDSSTVISIPPLFLTNREMPRKGLVIYELQKT